MMIEKKSFDVIRYVHVHTSKIQARARNKEKEEA